MLGLIGKHLVQRIEAQYVASSACDQCREARQIGEIPDAPVTPGAQRIELQ
jgi:hypothetical protein